MEAHACNEWPLGTRTIIQQHTSTENRIKAAKQFQEEYSWPIPMVVDNIANEFHNAYTAWPERVFVINDGKMAYIAMAGDDGYDFLWPQQVLEFFKTEEGSKLF